MVKNNWIIDELSIVDRTYVKGRLYDSNNPDNGEVWVILSFYYTFEDPGYYAEPEGSIGYVVTGQDLDGEIEAKILDPMLDYATDCADYLDLEADRLSAMADYYHDLYYDR